MIEQLRSDYRAASDNLRQQRAKAHTIGGLSDDRLRDAVFVLTAQAIMLNNAYTENLP